MDLTLRSADGLGGTSLAGAGWKGVCMRWTEMRAAGGTSGGRRWEEREAWGPGLAQETLEGRGGEGGAALRWCLPWGPHGRVLTALTCDPAVWMQKLRTREAGSLSGTPSPDPARVAFDLRAERAGQELGTPALPER